MTSERSLTRFGDLLAEPVRNGIYKAKEFHGRGAKIINMGEIFAHHRIAANVEMKRLEVTDSELSRFSVAPGDLLFARRSLTAEGAGKCSIVLDVDDATVFESSIIRARPDPELVDGRFLYYLFSSELGIQLLQSIRRQVAVAGITGRDLADLALPLPTLREQRRAADVLSALDEKVDHSERLCARIEEVARTLFEEKVGRILSRDGVLSAVPEGYSRHRLDELMTLNPRRALAKGTLAPYLEMKNMPVVGHFPSAWADRQVTSGARFMNGDTLVARITPCLENGKVCFVDFLNGETVGWGSTEYIVLAPNASLPQEFAYFVARHEAFRDFAVRHMSGSSGRQRVAADAVAAFEIALPGPAETEALGSLLSDTLAQIRACRLQTMSIERVRDTLLPGLVSGALVAPDIDRRAHATSTAGTK